MGKTKVFDCYGLYVTKDDVKEYAEDYEVYPEEVLKENGIIFKNADGEFLEVDDWHSVKLKPPRPDDCFAIFTCDDPGLFDKCFDNYEQAIEYFEKNFGSLLPDNFDYYGKFVRFLGVMNV